MLPAIILFFALILSFLLMAALVNGKVWSDEKASNDNQMSWAITIVVAALWSLLFYLLH